MNLNSILSNHHIYKDNTITNRFFKHQDLLKQLAQLPPEFTISALGKSVKQRSINLVKWGNGSTKVMLWSQMHGDEATGTMALFDLFKFLQTDSKIIEMLGETCQLFMIPMVNPDGAEIFTRRNIQQIDINRDFLNELTPEAKILKKCRTHIKPDFGFNLHDQTTLWSVTESLKPATLSFLAPAIDKELTINQTRENAMLVIADIFKDMDEFIPNHIGLFDDEFEPRAFGDNFQLAGTSTILIEAGGYQQDFEKQEIRKYYFGAILSGLISIAKKTYEKQKLENYFAIPKNNKQIFHIIINNVIVEGIEVSIGLNFEEIPTEGGKNTIKIYSIEDIGDLSFCDAYTVYSGTDLKIEGNILFNKEANFTLCNQNRIILSFANGKLS